MRAPSSLYSNDASPSFVERLVDVRGGVGEHRLHRLERLQR